MLWISLLSSAVLHIGKLPPSLPPSLSLSLSLSPYVCTCVCVCVCVCTYMYMYMYVYVCMYIGCTVPPSLKLCLRLSSCCLEGWRQLLQTDRFLLLLLLLIPATALSCENPLLQCNGGRSSSHPWIFSSIGHQVVMSSWFQVGPRVSYWRCLCRRRVLCFQLSCGIPSCCVVRPLVADREVAADVCICVCTWHLSSGQGSVCRS